MTVQMKHLLEIFTTDKHDQRIHAESNLQNNITRNTDLSLLDSINYSKEERVDCLSSNCVVYGRILVHACCFRYTHRSTLN